MPWRKRLLHKSTGVKHAPARGVHNRFVLVGYSTFDAMPGQRLLWSNAVIAVAAIGAVFKAGVLAGSPAAWNREHALFACGIGAATWLAYTWQRHVKSTRPAGLRPAHIAWHRRHRRTLLGTGFALLPLASVPFLRTVGTWPTPVLAPGPVSALGAALLLVALYAGFPGTAGARFALRRLPRVKLLLIGLVWSIITAGWPIGVFQPDPWTATTGWILTERVCTIMALTLPFDLRDRHWDPPEFNTIPQLWGATGTRWIAASFLLVSSGCLLMVPAADGLTPAMPLLMIPFVAMADENRPAGYYLLLDSLLLLDAAAVWVWC